VGTVEKARVGAGLTDAYNLGGQVKTGNLWTGQNRQFPAAETSEFYFVPSSVRKSVWTFVRQLRGPHFSTCA
jgi:hypothetical protein